MKFRRYKTPGICNRAYVRIKQCTSGVHCWYNNKIGQVFLASNDYFQPNYVIVDCLENKRGLFPLIKKEDSEIVIPNLRDKILLIFEMANYERSTDWILKKLNK